jgi:hypothetical protein
MYSCLLYVHNPDRLIVHRSLPRAIPCMVPASWSWYRAWSPSILWNWTRCLPEADCYSPGLKIGNGYKSSLSDRSTLSILAHKQSRFVQFHLPKLTRTCYRADGWCLRWAAPQGLSQVSTHRPKTTSASHYLRIHDYFVSLETQWGRLGGHHWRYHQEVENVPISVPGSVPVLVLGWLADEPCWTS